MKITGSAPGKVVILGEYAVLEGAPALVMAVDRRVHVSLTTHRGRYCSVTAPGWATGAGQFQLGPKGPTWLDGADARFTLAAHVVGKLFQGDVTDAAGPPFELVLDSGTLTERGPCGPQKLGLGSSAALTVALCRVLGYYAASQHNAGRGPDLRTMIDIHSGFQHRRGSGLDVAASLYGGLLEYSRSPTPHVREATLPPELAYRFVWSGRQAATGRFLAKIDGWRQSHESQYRGIMEALWEVSHAGLEAARADDGDDLMRLINEYVAALESLGTAAGADILSQPHQTLRAVAKRSDVVYKPCGAGGGDIGIGLSRDPGALDGFLAAAVAEGFQPLSLQCDGNGVSARSGN